MIVITGIPRSCTSLLLKCFEDGGANTGLEGKQRSEDQNFRRLCYETKKKLGMKPLNGGVLDERLCDYLMPPRKTDRVEVGFDIDLDVVKYPLMSDCIESFPEAFYIFMYRADCVERIGKFVKHGLYCPKLIKKNVDKFPEWATKLVIKNEFERFGKVNTEKMVINGDDYVVDPRRYRKMIRERTGFDINTERVGGMRVA